MDRATEIIRELQVSYAMELETVENFLANSINLDEAPAERIKHALAENVEIELRHARRLATRIKVLGGRVPGSLELSRNQHTVQPPADPADVASVARGVIFARRPRLRSIRKSSNFATGLILLPRTSSLHWYRTNESTGSGSLDFWRNTRVKRHKMAKSRPKPTKPPIDANER